MILLKTLVAGMIGITVSMASTDVFAQSGCRIFGQSRGGLLSRFCPNRYEPFCNPCPSDFSNARQECSSDFGYGMAPSPCCGTDSGCGSGFAFPLTESTTQFMSRTIVDIPGDVRSTIDSIKTKLEKIQPVEGNPTLDEIQNSLKDIQKRLDDASKPNSNPADGPPSAPDSSHIELQRYFVLFRMTLANAQSQISRINLPRKWVDNTGKYSTWGWVIETSADEVTILKTSGCKCVVPMQRLSNGDREFVTMSNQVFSASQLLAFSR